MIGPDSVYYAWQGNVRLYKKDNDNLQLLTTDHLAVGGNTTLLRHLNSNYLLYYTITNNIKK